MNLVHCSVVIKNIDHFTNKEVTRPFYPVMWLEAIVTCPSCGGGYAITTKKLVLGGPHPASYALYLTWTIQEMTETQECEFCGVGFSPVPKSVRKGFVENLSTTYTTNWADAEIKKIRAQAEEPAIVK